MSTSITLLLDGFNQKIENALKIKKKLEPEICQSLIYFKLLQKYMDIFLELRLIIQKVVDIEICSNFDKIMKGIHLLFNYCYPTNDEQQTTPHSKKETQPEKLPNIQLQFGHFGGIKIDSTFHHMRNMSTHTTFNKNIDFADNNSPPMTIYTERTQREKYRSTKQKIMLNKETSTFLDYQENLKDVLDEQRKRDQKIDELLLETNENLRVFEEILENKQDLSLISQSSIKINLEELIDALGNKKLEYESVIKKIDIEEIKKKKDNYDYIQKALQEQIHEIQQSTAEKIIKLFNNKFHKYKQMQVQKQQNKKGKSDKKKVNYHLYHFKQPPTIDQLKEYQAGGDCKCTYYLYEIVELKSKCDGIESDLKQRKLDLQEKDIKVKDYQELTKSLTKKNDHLERECLDLNKKVQNLLNGRKIQINSKGPKPIFNRDVQIQKNDDQVDWQAIENMKENAKYQVKRNVLLDNVIYVLINRQVDIPAALKKLQQVLNITIVQNQIPELIKLIKEVDQEGWKKQSKDSNDPQKVKIIQSSDQGNQQLNLLTENQTQSQIIPSVSDKPQLSRSLSKSPQLKKQNQKNSLKKQGSFAHIPSSQEDSIIEMNQDKQKKSNFFKRQNTQKLEIQTQLRYSPNQSDDQIHQESETLDKQLFNSPQNQSFQEKELNHSYPINPINQYSLTVQEKQERRSSFLNRIGEENEHNSQELVQNNQNQVTKSCQTDKSLLLNFLKTISKNQKENQILVELLQQTGFLENDNEIKKFMGDSDEQQAQLENEFIVKVSHTQIKRSSKSSVSKSLNQKRNLKIMKEMKSQQGQQLNSQNQSLTNSQNQSEVLKQVFSNRESKQLAKQRQRNNSKVNSLDQKKQEAQKQFDKQNVTPNSKVKQNPFQQSDYITINHNGETLIISKEDFNKFDEETQKKILKHLENFSDDSITINKKDKKEFLASDLFSSKDLEQIKAVKQKQAAYKELIQNENNKNDKLGVFLKDQKQKQIFLEKSDGFNQNSHSQSLYNITNLTLQQEQKIFVDEQNKVIDEQIEQNILLNPPKHFKVMEDQLTEDVVQQMYKNLIQNKPELKAFNNQKLVDLIKQYKGKNSDQSINLSDFQEFLKKLQNVHKPCGKDCIHLLRFYLRLGFINNKFYSNKQFLKLSKSTPNPFKQ